MSDSIIFFRFLQTVSVVKCRKLSENLIERINTMESIFLRRFNISGTDAGYYQLWNVNIFRIFFLFVF